MTNKPTAELIAWHRQEAKDCLNQAEALYRQSATKSSEARAAIAKKHKASADRLAELEALLKGLTQDMPHDREEGCGYCFGRRKDYDKAIEHETYCPWEKAKQALQPKDGE